MRRLGRVEALNIVRRLHGFSQINKRDGQSDYAGKKDISRKPTIAMGFFALRTEIRVNP
jgi:hypothetical protein